MIRQKFPPTDPLLCDVCRAYDAIHALRIRPTT
jgi:hypothetical protein